MPIDFSQMHFSEQPIEGIEQDQENWKSPSEFPPPPDPGTYRAFIKQIRDVREKITDKGPRLVVSYDAHLVELDRTINFNWISNIEFNTNDRGRTSTMLDMVKSAGVTGVIRTNQDFAKILDKMEGNNQFTFRINIDWRGSCRTCYAQKLMELTGDDTSELAAAHASKEQKDEANKFALKFKNFRQFPPADTDPMKRKSTAVCADCGDEIRAQANINRYLASEK